MDKPLVTILLPTYNRTWFLMNRSLPSAMNQTYDNLEILVIGDGTEQDTVDAMAKVTDPRVRFVNLPHSTYPTEPIANWQVRGTIPLNWGIDNAKGAWLTMLGDDDEFLPTHVETLLTHALETDADYVYGIFEFMTPLGEPTGMGGGSWPPNVACMGNGLWKASLGYHYNPQSWQKGLPCDWELITRMLEGGVRFAFVPEKTYSYYASAWGGT